MYRRFYLRVRFEHFPVLIDQASSHATGPHVDPDKVFHDAEINVNSLAVASQFGSFSVICKRLRLKRVFSRAEMGHVYLVHSPSFFQQVDGIRECARMHCFKHTWANPKLYVRTQTCLILPKRRVVKPKFCVMPVVHRKNFEEIGPVTFGYLANSQRNRSVFTFANTR